MITSNDALLTASIDTSACYERSDASLLWLAGNCLSFDNSSHYLLKKRGVFQPPWLLLLKLRTQYKEPRQHIRLGRELRQRQMTSTPGERKTCLAYIDLGSNVLTNA